MSKKSQQFNQSIKENTDLLVRKSSKIIEDLSSVAGTSSEIKKNREQLLLENLHGNENITLESEISDTQQDPDRNHDHPPNLTIEENTELTRNITDRGEAARNRRRGHITTRRTTVTSRGTTRTRRTTRTSVTTRTSGTYDTSTRRSSVGSQSLDNQPAESVSSGYSSPDDWDDNL